MARKQLKPTEVRALVRGVGVLASFVDRFGIAFTVLLVLIFTVRWMGSAATQDLFIRELLFGEVTRGRSLAVFFAALIGIAILGVESIGRAYFSEQDEIQRLVKERDVWQERALETELSHSDDIEAELTTTPATSREKTTSREKKKT